MLASDVLVIGGGNAGLCAAIAARQAGASVAVVERAPIEWRGGNSKYTRNLRCVQDQVDGGYSEKEFADDLAAVTGPGSNQELTALLIERSRSAPAWMEAHGIRWQSALNGTLSLGRTNRFFLGGGKALVNNYADRATALGAKIRYGWRVTDLDFDGARCSEVWVAADREPLVIRPKAVVIASGGFEANLEWLASEVGAGVKNAAVRGTRGNDGAVLRLLLDHGARATGTRTGFHAIAVDARGPQFEGGIVTRVDSVPLSIVVNRHGERFADEGEDLWPKRYASWGKRILEQPDQIAYSVFDAKVRNRFMSTVYPPLEANSLAELALAVELDPDRLERTVHEYNASVRSGLFDPQKLDTCWTVGLNPPKSHWAQAIDQPPYYAYPLRPGITFTYLGVEVNREARVLREAGVTPFSNLFAAGEVMAGNILRRGYLAGVGMTIGTVFGCIAGQEAAKVAQA